MTRPETPDPLDVQLDRGVAIGYVYGRHAAGDQRLSLSDAWWFTERFLAAGRDWRDLESLYERLAAEKATHPTTSDLEGDHT